MCRLLYEGPVAVTLINGIKYTEPFTQSKNSRTVSIKKGKSYYFRVSGTGVLEYIFDADKGEKNFANAKDFNAPPGSFTETSGDIIPLLANNSN